MDLLAQPQAIQAQHAPTEIPVDMFQPSFRNL